MPSLGEEDLPLLDVPQRVCLYRELARRGKEMDREFVTAILNALETLKDCNAIDDMRLFLKEVRCGLVVTSGAGDLEITAERCLDSLIVRQRELETEQTLVRAACQPAAAADSLLRAAAAQPDTMPEQLQRAGAAPPGESQGPGSDRG